MPRNNRHILNARPGDKIDIVAYHKPSRERRTFYNVEVTPRMKFDGEKEIIREVTWRLGNEKMRAWIGFMPSSFQWITKAAAQRQTNFGFRDCPNRFRISYYR